MSGIFGGGPDPAPKREPVKPKRAARDTLIGSGSTRRRGTILTGPQGAGALDQNTTSLLGA